MVVSILPGQRELHTSACCGWQPRNLELLEQIRDRLAQLGIPFSWQARTTMLKGTSKHCVVYTNYPTVGGQTPSLDQLNQMLDQGHHSFDDPYELNQQREEVQKNRRQRRAQSNKRRLQIRWSNTGHAL